MPPPYPYSNIERYDIVRLSIQTNSTRRTQQLFHELHPNVPIPRHNLINRMHQNLRDFGQFTVPQHAQAPGRPRRHPDDLDRRILRFFARDPRRSTRQAARRFRVSQSFVWLLLNLSDLHPFHFRPVQDILPTDFAGRVTFCQWFERNIETNILWSDESTFTRDGQFNVHNEHFWAAENPRLTRRNAFQVRFSVNVWAGIINETLIGPIFIEERLNGGNYLNLLRHMVTELLDEVPLWNLNNLHFQHDGAPAHFEHRVRDYLNAEFPGRWIGRGGPIAWPPRSPDLTPLDFYLWSDVKRIVYEQESNTVQELRQRIRNAFDEIRASNSLRRIKNNHRRRAELCQEQHGGHFEHLLNYV